MLGYCLILSFYFTNCDPDCLSFLKNHIFQIFLISSDYAKNFEPEPIFSRFLRDIMEVEYWISPDCGNLSWQLDYVWFLQTFSKSQISNLFRFSHRFRSGRCSSHSALACICSCKSIVNALLFSAISKTWLEWKNMKWRRNGHTSRS